MLTQFTDWIGLGAARVVASTETRESPDFDVVSMRELSRRREILSALDEHASLGGHFHVASRDPWKCLRSPEGDSWTAFQERSSALVAWRDPIGPIEGRGRALDHFRRYAARVGKAAVVLGASADLELASRDLGFASTWIGSEPFFDLSSFHTEGKRGEKLRLAMNHMRRVGGEAREIHPSRCPLDRGAMTRVERAWKAARPERENPSFLRTEPLENADARRYFAVETRGPSGPRMQSFLVCSPVSRRGWYLQDLVRDPAAPRGATELVAVHAMERLRDEGFDFATMGIVPLLDPDGTHAVGASTRWALSHFDALYRFAGLKQFRSKFAPSWNECVFVLHPPAPMSPLVVWNIVSMLTRAP